MAIEKKNFFGGLNSDDEDRLLPNGDYRFALNIRGSKPDGSNQGAIENTKGNKLLGITLPLGINRVIGAYDDINNNKVYYFLFNSRSSHSIYEYSASTNTISLVIQTPLLKFKSTEYITDPFIIGGLLFFRDNVNPPRRINIERAKTNGYPLPFEESFINAIVKAPNKPAEVEYNDDSQVSVNNVRGKLFQFRYKWVYLDNEESAWSPISKTPLPKDEGSFRPFLYYPVDKNNVIDVTVNIGTEHVKKIKIAAREGNTGDFFLVTEIDKSNINTTINDYVYKFYNDEIPISIDNDGNTGMRLFDNVPLKADGQSLIDGNRVAYSGITEGYDPVDIDIDITVNQETSLIQPTPSISFPLNSQHYSGFGFNYLHYESTSNKGRKIGNNLYMLRGIEKQSNRPSPTSSPAILANGNLLFPPFAPQGAGYYGSLFNTAPFQAGAVRDRAIKFVNDATGKTIQTGGSAINEVLIDDPAPNSSGIRFILSVRVEYIDIGASDSQKTKYIKVQYTSQLGDTALTICNALKQELINFGTANEGLVDIKADKSLVVGGGGWSFGVGNIGANQALLRIYGEAYVPAADKKADPNPAWSTATGGDTGALYWLKSELTAYADWTSQSNKHLKDGATHGIGLVYYDDEQRSGLTNISQKKTFYVPFFSERNIPQNHVPNPNTLTLQINHQAPSWAKKCQVVYTGNQTIDYIPSAEGYKGFIQFKLQGVSNSNITGAKEATIQNIIDYNNTIPETSNLGYSYTKGDRIRFIATSITNTSSNYLNDYRDVEVISFDETTNKITFKDPNINVPDNMLVEVYTPKKKQSEDFYFEIGECFDVSNGLHSGTTQNQTQNQPAIIELEDIGDVYLKFRVSPINSVIEDYSYSDYYTSDSWNKGRANRVDNNITQVKRETTIRYSNSYIPETNINGLSQFDDVDFETYDQQYGGIKKIYSEDKNLIVFFEQKVGKIMVNQSTLYDNEGNAVGTVKRENTVLSDVVYYTGEYGIANNPESFAVYGNRIYFTDVNRGVVLRLGGDGITPISEYKMHNYFNDTFKKIIDSGNSFKLFGAYDIRFDEYILSIQENVDEIPIEIDIEVPVRPPDSRELPILDEPVDDNNNPIEATLTDNLSIPGASSTSRYAETLSAQVGESVSEDISTNPTEEESSSSSNLLTPAEIGVGELELVSGSDSQITYLTDTIVFSEVKNRWVTHYSFVPDYMISNNINFISFNSGQLYIHNQNNTYNNYYGLQFTTMLEILSNAEPSANKIYNHIFTESTSPFSMPLATNQYGQKTSLITSDFEEYEGVYKAHFLRDENTPNTTNPLIEGDTIRCHSMSILLENNSTELVKIFAVGIGVELSELTNR